MEYTIDDLKDAFEAGREYQEYKHNANLEEKSWDYTFEKWLERKVKKLNIPDVINQVCDHTWKSCSGEAGAYCTKCFIYDRDK